MCVLMEAYFPSESTLPLSGEINANKGSAEDEEGVKRMTKKRLKRGKTNKSLASREGKKE